MGLFHHRVAEVVDDRGDEKTQTRSMPFAPTGALNGSRRSLAVSDVAQNDCHEAQTDGLN
jgi:hypothetical protein